MNYDKGTIIVSTTFANILAYLGLFIVLYFISSLGILVAIFSFFASASIFTETIINFYIAGDVQTISTKKKYYQVLSITILVISIILESANIIFQDFKIVTWRDYSKDKVFYLLFFNLLGILRLIFLNSSGISIKSYLKQVKFQKSKSVKVYSNQITENMQIEFTENDMQNYN